MQKIVQVPKQINEDELKNLQSISQSVSLSGQSTLVVVLILQFLFNFAGNSVLGSIRNLSIIVHLFLLKL